MSTALALLRIEYEPTIRLYAPPPEIDESLPSVPGKKSRKRLRLLQDDPHCYFCRGDLTADNSTLDHLIPQSRGGTNESKNLRLCCPECNVNKGNRTPSEWLRRLRGQALELQQQFLALSQRADSLEGLIFTDGLEYCLAPKKRKAKKL